MIYGVMVQYDNSKKGMLHPNSADTFQLLNQGEDSLGEGTKTFIDSMIYLSNGVSW